MKEKWVSCDQVWNWWPFLPWFTCGVEWYWAGKLTTYDMRVWIWVCVFVNSELHRKNFAQILSLGSVFDQTFSEYLCCTKENHPDWEVFIFSLLLLPERNNMGEQKSTHQGVGSWRGSTNVLGFMTKLSRDYRAKLYPPLWPSTLRLLS